MSSRCLMNLIVLLSLPSLVLAADPIAYIVQPAHGEVVRSPFKVVFGLSGMGVAPAGIDRPKTGHHHLIIDGELPNLNAPIPSSDTYRHFGGGETEVTIELPRGQHTLQLLMGNYVHVPHTPPVVSKKITITVK